MFALLLVFTLPLALLGLMLGMDRLEQGLRQERADSRAAQRLSSAGSHGVATG